MEAKFIRGNAVWVIHDYTMVTKGYVLTVQELKTEVVYRVRLVYGTRKLAGDTCIFKNEREACAELHRRMLGWLETLRKRAGIRPQPVAGEAVRPAAPVASTVRVPAKFFNDHEERECEPFCAPVKRTARYVWLRVDDPGLPELLSDAEYYGDTDGGPDAIEDGGALHRSAAATARAIRDAVGDCEHEDPIRDGWVGKDGRP